MFIMQKDIIEHKIDRSLFLKRCLKTFFPKKSNNGSFYCTSFLDFAPKGPIFQIL